MPPSCSGGMEVRLILNTNNNKIIKVMIIEVRTKDFCL
jgi:hypothetical protein